jgi:hypothetical protein
VGRRRGPADRACGPPPQPLVDARAVERVQALGEQLQLVAVRVVRLAHRAPGRRVARRSCRCSRGLLLVVAVLQTFLAAVVVRRWRQRGEHQRGVREQDGLVEPASAEPRAVAHQRVAPLRRRRPPARAEEGGGRDRHHGSHDQQHVFRHDARGSAGSLPTLCLPLQLQHVACWRPVTSFFYVSARRDSCGQYLVRPGHIKYPHQHDTRANLVIRIHWCPWHNIRMTPAGTAKKFACCNRYIWKKQSEFSLTG